MREIPPLPEQHRVFSCLNAFSRGAFSLAGMQAEIEAFAREYAMAYAEEAVRQARFNELMDAATEMQIEVMNHDLPVECEDAYDWLGKRAAAIRESK